MEQEKQAVSWLEITVRTTPQEMEETCAQLAGGGMVSISIEDEADFKAFLAENQQYWDYVDQELEDAMKGVCHVKFYVTDNEDGKAQLEEHLRLVTKPYEITPLLDKDWEYSWQKYYKPMEIGEKLIVIPHWELDKPIPPGRVPCILDPGLTFGTGAHPTTQLCLEGVETHVKPGDFVLDLGCGSGILSIASQVLGAKEGIALDIDPLTQNIAYENAKLNHITPETLQVLIGDVLTDQNLRDTITQKKYPLVLANIVADVILALAPLVKEVLEENGVFLCSGIIDSRGNEVEEALKSQGFMLIRKRERKGWVALEWQLGKGDAM